MDLDDDELKATRNKFYKYNKNEFDKNHVFILSNDKIDQEMNIKDKIKEIRDKAELMDYYSLNDVIDDLSKLIGDYEENE